MNTLTPSALGHFDPTALLDGLSAGIIVLDRHLCAIYANGVAQRLLRFSLDEARGRPFVEVVGTASGLIKALQRVLQDGDRLLTHDSAIWPACLRRSLGSVSISATMMVGQITGTHLLLEVGRAKPRLVGLHNAASRAQHSLAAAVAN